MERLLIACFAAAALDGHDQRHSAPMNKFPTQRVPSAQTSSSLDTLGTTWQLACSGCPAVTMTVWNDGAFWIRRSRTAPAKAEILHGHWTRESSRLSMFAEESDAPTFVLEGRPDAMRLVKTGGDWPASVKLPVALTRAKAVDLIDEETTFTGVWNGYVHDMREWTDCRTGEYMTVESQTRIMPRDSAFVLRGHYRHWIGKEDPPPREWHAPTRALGMELKHAFLADAVVGGLARKKCAYLTRKPR